jgi:hypothetical protein
MTARGTVRRLVSQREGFEGGPGSGPRKTAGGTPRQKTNAHFKKAIAYAKAKHNDTTTPKSLRFLRGEDHDSDLKYDLKKYANFHSKGDHADPKMVSLIHNIINSIGKKSSEAGGQVAPRYDSSHPEGFVDHRYPDHKGNLGQEAKEGGQGSGPHARLAQEHARASAHHDHTATKLFGSTGAPGAEKAHSAASRAHTAASKAHSRAEQTQKPEDAREAKLASQAAEHLTSAAEKLHSSKESKKGWTGRQKDMHKEIGKQIARESNRRGSSGPIKVNSDLGHPIDLRSISSQQTFREGWNGGMSYSPPVKRIKKVMEAEAGTVEIKEF